MKLLLQFLIAQWDEFVMNVCNYTNTNCKNKQNMWYRSGTNPPELNEQPLHSERVTVWWTFSRIGIIGTFFWREWSGHYSDFWALCPDDYRVFFLKVEEIEVRNVRFRQDGARAHATQSSMTLLREHSPNVSFVWVFILSGQHAHQI